jgi:hypothetical protein
LTIQRLLGLRVASPIELTDGAETRPGACDVRFQLEPPAPQGEVPTPEPIEIRTLDDTPYLQMGQVASGFLLRFPDWADFVVGHDGATVVCTPVPGIPVETVRHLLLGQVLPRAMSLRRDPALHGSATGRHDGAIGFLGSTGHGKSTLALFFTRSGWTLLGDDCLLLRRLASAVEVVPNGVGARLWPDTADDLLAGQPSLPAVAHYTEKLRVDNGVGGLVLADRPARLRRLYLLDPRDGSPAPPEIEPLEARQAFEELLQHVMRLPPTDAERLRREFDFLTRLATQVAVRRLRFPWAFEQLPAVRAAIEADLRREP